MSLPIYYKKSPVFVQNLLVSLRGWQIQKTRFNKEFYQLLKHFEESDPNEVNEERFGEFIKQANNTPFWNERFRQYEIDIKALNLLEELKKLPVLTKEEVKENVEQIKNSLIAKKDLKKIQTSGTTGSGLVFYQTQLMENAQWAVWWRYRRRLGINLNQWCGWFGGRTIIDINQGKPPYWRINKPGKQVMFSAHHLNLNTVEEYYNEIKRRNLEWLHGYPSQLAFLSSLIKEKGLIPLQMSHITVGGENLLEYQKNNIQQMLGAFPYNHYGLAEGVANISQYPDEHFGCDQDFSFCEFISKEDDGSKYRIIGTNYYNDAFPLIRYDTNDLISLKKDKDRVIINSIDGRNEDFITLPNGVKLGRLDHIFKSLTFVREAQLYQPKKGKLIIKIVKGEGYNQFSSEKQILENARERLGSEIYIEIEYLEKIPRTKSGKLKFVISDI